MAICPMCGYESRGGWSQCDEGHVFEQSIDSLVAAGAAGRGGSVSVPAGMTVERRRPARAANLRSDVVVPFIQATITGLLGTVGGSILAALVNLVGANLDIAIIGSATGLITAGKMWWTLLQEHRDLLWEIETRTGRDLDGDGEKGKPKKAQSTTIEVHIPPGKDGKGKQVLFLSFPIPPEKIHAFARGVLNGRPTAEAAWTGSGGLFSKPDFVRLRDELIERELARWRDPEAHAQGWCLRAVGRRVFEIIVGEEE